MDAMDKNCVIDTRYIELLKFCEEEKRPLVPNKGIENYFSIPFSVLDKSGGFSIDKRIALISKIKECLQDIGIHIENLAVPLILQEIRIILEYKIRNKARLPKPFYQILHPDNLLEFPLLHLLHKHDDNSYGIYCLHIAQPKEFPSDYAFFTTSHQYIESGQSPGMHATKVTVGSQKSYFGEQWTLFLANALAGSKPGSLLAGKNPLSTPLGSIYRSIWLRARTERKNQFRAANMFEAMVTHNLPRKLYGIISEYLNIVGPINKEKFQVFIDQLPEVTPGKRLTSPGTRPKETIKSQKY